LYTLISLFLTAFSVIFINWWAPFVAVPANDYLQNVRNHVGGQMLPSWLKWFDTFDASIDAGWMNGYFTDKYTTSTPPSFLLRKWYQIRWLYRNPAQGADYWLLGIPFNPDEWSGILLYSTVNGSLFHAQTQSGFFNTEFTALDKVCLKVGWKAWNYYDVTTYKFKNEPWGPEMRVPFCFTYIPYSLMFWKKKSDNSNS